MSTPKEAQTGDSVRQAVLDVLLGIQITECSLTAAVSKVMSIAVDADDLSLMMLALGSFGRIFLAAGDVGKSAFLFNQLVRAGGKPIWISAWWQ